MMTRFAVFFLLAALITPAARAQTLSLRSAGKETQKWSVKEMVKRAPLQTLSLDGGANVYRVIPLAPLLKAGYPDPFKSSPDFFFVCSDGYRAAVPGPELQRYPAYLAIGRADGKPFVDPKDKKSCAPFYLVWDTNKYPQRKIQGSWPYQVVAIDREAFAERYPKVPPPAGSSAPVMNGFKAFRKYCISCHQVNGQGGQMAIDLNSPRSVTEYIKEPYLAQIIDNPQKVRGRATMPGLIQGLPNRKQVIKDIIAYLKVKAAVR